MNYDGIKIRGPINAGESDDFTAPVVAGETITWFKVSDQYLGMPRRHAALTRTPSELIQLWFGDSLRSSDDGLSSISRLGGDDWDDTGDIDDTTWQLWRNTTTTAYMVTAVIGNLPPISTTASGVAGFLDWSQSWGLVYDADVLYKNMQLGETVYALTSDTSSAAKDTALVSSMMTRDWIVAGPDDIYDFGEDLTSNSVWPQGAYSDLIGWYDNPTGFINDLTGFGSGNNRPMAYATYGLEAVGYDAYDDLGADGATIDANEALHSNELYRFAPAAASEEVMHAPGILTAVPLGWSPGTFYISWTYPSVLHETFAGAYHAESDDGDSYTYADSDNPWKKTHDQEIIDMNSTIDEVCKIIGPTLETTEFPKRFINHIQRKRKIPNNMVSAFGYVPGAIYTANTIDTFTSGSTDTVSYDPVTGEVMDTNAEWSVMHPGGEMVGEARGYRDDDWSSGEDADSTTRDDGSDATRYEGWDD